MLFIFSSINLTLTDILLLSVLFTFSLCMFMYYKQKYKEMSKTISLQTGSPSHLDSIFSSKLWFIYKFKDESKIDDMTKFNCAKMCTMIFQSNPDTVSI